MEAEKKLEELGLTLPPIPTPVANYLPLVRTGNLLFVSGHGPGVLKDGSASFIQGKLGKDLDVEQGYDAAKQVMLNILQSMKQELGDLDKVRKVVKLLGFVNCTPDFPRPAQSDQRRIRPARRPLWRARPSCPLGRGHEPASVRHRR